MSGMTSIYVGVSGLQAASTGLNTTSHNLSNVYTKGYTRQLSINGDRTYVNIGSSSTSYMQVGLGVDVISTSRVRNILLDKAYRTENSRANFYTAQYNAATEVTNILGEINGESFDKTLENLENAISEMTKTPNSETAQSELVMFAEKFIQRANGIYQDMKEYQDNLDAKIKGMIEEVNGLGRQIDALNKAIAGVEASNIQDANDLLDQRDLALDKLSEYVKITYQEGENKYVTVNIEGVPFVSDTGVFEMGMKQLNGQDVSVYISAVWPHLDDQEVFNFNQEIGPARNNDKGSLKGYILARGDFNADYTDLPRINDYDLSDPVQAKKYYEDVDKYMKNVDQCTLAKSEALFDNLIHGIVTALNNVFSPMTKGMPTGVTTFTDANGKTYPDGVTYTADNIEVLDMTTSTGADGEMPPQELFSRIGVERYIEVTGNDGNTYYIFNKLDDRGYESLYKCGNLEINPKILESYAKIPFTTKEGEEDYRKANKLLEAWNGKFCNLDPDSLAQLKFTDYYDQYIYELGNDGEFFKNLAASETDATNTLDAQRTEIHGVNSDEELTNMIKFQNAYNASSRYITVVSDMLEHIINRLGA